MTKCIYFNLILTRERSRYIITIPYRGIVIERKEGDFVLNDKEKVDLKLRLKKVAGQINGIDKMIDEGRYCVDVVQQILAARAALNRVSLIILESHAKSCVVTAIKENHAEESIEELMAVFKQLSK